MHFEVEQKFRIDDATAIERRLRELGVGDAGTIVQVDQYFNHPSRDFAQTDEALRLRQVGDTNFVTYKGPKLDTTTKTRREIELPLPVGAAMAAAFAELLVALGFRFVAEVRKTRRQMHVSWQGRMIEVVLDNVDRLGTFVELELSADDAELDDAKACVAALAAELQLSGSERRSYLEMVLGRQTPGVAAEAKR